MLHYSVKIQELIHIHALLLETREYLEREGDVPDSAFDSYDTQSIRPSHIHRQKDAHMSAIFMLLDGFDQSVQTHPPPDRVTPF
ncbi:UPF0058 family protein [Halobacteria archaeon AArc-m2/3/4]|uniref:UPF0058 family protein n=2 Tax=Natronoglomus mannanivorans TaxID=2979990 RepID=A0AAP2Z1Y2_9EURY|nr:UPF0058 family protein [Halobacteria archaeon AArc-xg1-1]MCU4972819.1 UPF0058 family protein [Halobacteria archaeon AArc-m2/3/4]